MGIYTPHRIEAFDNSNIQGTNPVSAMVVFIDGKAEKREYRKYKIKTVMVLMIMNRCVKLSEEGIPEF